MAVSLYKINLKKKTDFRKGTASTVVLRKGAKKINLKKVNDRKENNK